MAPLSYPKIWFLLFPVSFCLLALFSRDVLAFSYEPPTPKPSRVLVTGASGRTGQLVFEALLKDPAYDPKAAVRSERSAKKLRKSIPQTGLDQIVVCDVTTLCDGKSDFAPAPEGLNDIDKLIICTSAVPVISKRSLLKALLLVPFNIVRRRNAVDFRTFRFGWKAGQYPELVDYEGQINQIELAKKRGVKQIVVVGSMGGTDPDNFLNSVGKKPDGSGNGDILLWKRKAEKYLIESGVDYTIIHPGGLNDQPGGKEEFVLDVDDKLMGRPKRSISRSDVANMCIAALRKTEGKKIAFDVVTEATESSPVRSAEEALGDFLDEATVYDYSI